LKIDRLTVQNGHSTWIFEGIEATVEDFHELNGLIKKIMDFQLKLREPLPAPVIKPVRVSCDYKEYCTDYPDKCGECEHNRAASYFKPKGEGR